MAKDKLENVNSRTERKEAGVNTGAVYENIERGRNRKGRQPVASAEEQKERAENLKTRGRLGCSMQRVNMSFTPTNLQFVKVMGSVLGMTQTEFTNYVLDLYREAHAEEYGKAEDAYNAIMKLK